MIVTRFRDKAKRVNNRVTRYEPGKSEHEFKQLTLRNKQLPMLNRIRRFEHVADEMERARH